MPGIMDLFARILIAAFCGACIGIERERRNKGAGIRTHLIVALSASMMMIISKYAFNDVLFYPQNHDNLFRLDPSRVAAGIVAAIGFLGAGLIVLRSQTITGLTTAAGIWGTVGVGMAVGAGSWQIGLFGTAVILFVNLFLYPVFEDRRHGRMVFELIEAGPEIDEVLEWLKMNRFYCIGLRLRVRKDGSDVYTVEFHLKDKRHLYEIREMLARKLVLHELTIY